MTPSAPGLYKPSRRRRDNRRGLPRVAAVIVNLFWAYVTYTLCRALFIADNPALSLIQISEPTRHVTLSRMPTTA